MTAEYARGGVSWEQSTTWYPGVADIRAWQEGLYRDLHAHPELSHQEHRTSNTVTDRLNKLGYATTAGVGGTGVVGVFKNGAGPVVLVRADMDALPVRETTGLDYASDVTATNDAGEEVPVAHACGTMYTWRAS